MSLLKEMGIFQFIAMIIVLSSVVFFLTDWYTGYNEIEKVRVYTRKYKPAWVEHYIEYVPQYDASGYAHSRPVQKTRYHSEEYIFFIQGYSGRRQIYVTATDWYAIRVNQDIEIKNRYGKLTKLLYSTSITNY